MILLLLLPSQKNQRIKFLIFKLLLLLLFQMSIQQKQKQKQIKWPPLQCNLADCLPLWLLSS